MFRALAEDADFEYTMIDGTIVKVHRHGQGAKALSSLQATIAG
jgi:transposase-like protein